MGADHWAICPRCVDTAKNQYDEAFQEAVDAYGKVSEAEYEALKAAAVPVDEENHRTLGEYYEIYGASTGIVKVEYGSECRVCHLTTEFKHEHKFYDKATS